MFSSAIRPLSNAAFAAISMDFFACCSTFPYSWSAFSVLPCWAAALASTSNPSSTTPEKDSNSLMVLSKNATRSLWLLARFSNRRFTSASLYSNSCLSLDKLFLSLWCSFSKSFLSWLFSCSNIF